MTKPTPGSMSSRIAFIGAGNMARSLIGGLISGGRDPAELVAADPDERQRERLEALGVSTTGDNAAAASGAGLLVLAVKPQAMHSVVGPLAPALGSDQVLISVAAGIPVAALVAWCGKPMPIVRCMPNTPALYGAGITGIFANEQVSSEQLAGARAILDAAGETVIVDSEADLDAVTALSGSGPAYFFYLLEALIESGTELGLDAAVARRLATQTAYGAAVMVRDSGTAPAELRRNVMSPGGTTERAIGVLDSGGAKALFKDAIHQAAVRSRELGAEFGAGADPNKENSAND